mgnify:CR=1 FL=1
MNIQTITKKLIDSGIKEREAKKEVQLLLEYFCGYTEKDRLLGNSISGKQLELIQSKVDIRIKDRMPVQYIIGESYFMGNFFECLVSCSSSL